MSASLPVVQNFVHGRFLANSTGETFPVVNPATGQVIYEVEVADESVQQAAVESARAGFAEWSAMTAIERSRILLRAVALLRERNDELAAAEARRKAIPGVRLCIDCQSAHEKEHSQSGGINRRGSKDSQLR